MYTEKVFGINENWRLDTIIYRYFMWLLIGYNKFKRSVLVHVSVRAVDGSKFLGRTVESIPSNKCLIRFINAITSGKI